MAKETSNSGFYLQAKLIYWNTNKGNTERLLNEERTISIRNCLYEYQKRQGYARRYKSRVTKCKQFIDIKRIV